METETFNIDELLIRVLSHQAEQEEIVYFSKKTLHNMQMQCIIIKSSEAVDNILYMDP